MSEFFQLGDWEVTVVSGGTFRTDGGSMFGVVPKSLWSRQIDCDDHNQIAQQTHCLLARHAAGHVVLVDTGYGGKLPEKQRTWMSGEEGEPLLRNLRATGIDAADVTDVVFTHLHYDHAGGASRGSLDNPEPTFSNARHSVQRYEWDVATSEAPELRGAYPMENLRPLAEVTLNLLEGDSELLPGLRVVQSPGHTMGHQTVLLEGDGRTIAFLGDLCPTTRHFPILWCMAYDVDLLTTRRSKMRILGQAADQNWLLVLDHDPDYVAAMICRHEHKGFAMEKSFATLVESA